jgi:8-oxo-dGTP pyrophosphatase MutT (NUDIX family)
MTLFADATTVLSGLSNADADRFRKLLATGPQSVLPTAAGPHLTASALVVDPTRDLILLCLHGRIGKWLQMGGHCEPGDATLGAAALREASEESGIEGLTIGPQPIGLDVHPVPCRFGPSAHYDVRYAVLAPPGAAPVCSSESKDVAWFAPDALPRPLADGVLPLIEPALAWARSVAAGVHRT